VILFENLVFRLEDAIAFQPIHLIAMIVESRLVGDDHVRAEFDGFIDDLARGHEGRHDAFDFLRGIAGLHGIDSPFHGCARDGLENSINDLLNCSAHV
jgi:hypothetical protein